MLSSNPFDLAKEDSLLDLTLLAPHAFHILAPLHKHGLVGNLEFFPFAVTTVSRFLQFEHS